MRNRDQSDGGRITEKLLTFGEFVAEESPLYSRICLELAEDETVLRILSEARSDQPAPNIILGAVQFLLLEGAGSELGAHYPSIAGADAEPAGDPVELFAAFCRAEEERLTQIAARCRVQTNEVRRCTSLLPALAWVQQRTDRPLALIEIGASAGLNLLFDRYRYDYGAGALIGPPQSPLTLSTEVRSGSLPPLDPMPAVAWKRGIDLHPININDDDAIRWIRALLWPEQLDRIERFEAAVELARHDPPNLVAGDAIDLIPDIAAAAPEEATLAIFHTFVLNQFPPEARDRLDSVIGLLSRQREVHRIGIDMITRAERPLIKHTAYSAGDPIETILGSAHHHGAWLEWTA